MKQIIYSTALSILLVACGGGGGGDDVGLDPVALSLDGIYRGSPVVVSARDFTYDYEFDTDLPGGWRTVGSSGRVYTTTVTGNDVSGTATLYKRGAISTAALTGSITPGGAMSLHFQDGSSGAVNVNVQRLGGQSKTLLGRAWCTYAYDGVTVYYCSEFDILSVLRFSSPAHGTPRDLISVSLGDEVTPNVYEATVDWATCGNLTGLVGFAESEDGLVDEMAITVVGGSCGFMWFLLTSIR